MTQTPTPKKKPDAITAHLKATMPGFRAYAREIAVLEEVLAERAAERRRARREGGKR